MDTDSKEKLTVKYLFFMSLMLYACGVNNQETHSVFEDEYQRHEIKKNSDVQQNINSTLIDYQNWREILGDDDFRILLNNRGYYYHEKLNKDYAKALSEDPANIKKYAWGDGLNFQAMHNDFTGISILSDPEIIKVYYRGIIETYPGFFLFVPEIFEGEFNPDENIFTLYMEHHAGAVEYKVEIINENTIRMKMFLNGNEMGFSGIGYKPAIPDNNGFVTFYRWVGPGQLFIEYQDGTYGAP